MAMCEKCSQLPDRADAPPADALTSHLGPARRIGESTPHFPKKYVRECPSCGSRWGIAHVNSWDTKWVKLEQQAS
jgi:hypothetical protein